MLNRFCFRGIVLPVVAILFFVITGCADSARITALKKTNKKLKRKVKRLEKKFSKNDQENISDYKYMVYKDWTAVVKLIKMRSAIGKFYQDHGKFPANLDVQGMKPYLKEIFGSPEVPPVAGSRNVVKVEFTSKPVKPVGGWAYTASGYVYINSKRKTTGQIPLYRF